jgi:hypothetical protein
MSPRLDATANRILPFDSPVPVFVPGFPNLTEPQLVPLRPCLQAYCYRRWEIESLPPMEIPLTDLFSWFPTVGHVVWAAARHGLLVMPPPAWLQPAEEAALILPIIRSETEGRTTTYDFKTELELFFPWERLSDPRCEL